MQVNLNIRPDISVQGDARPVARRGEAKAGDHATFDHTAAVERALKDQPEARPEAVARGESVIGSPQYPPLEGIERISRLLAANWPATPE
jgi:hypothetical protein